MIRFQCDRCGKETGHGFRLIIPPKKQLDLCDECQAKFYEFMGINQSKLDLTKDFTKTLKDTDLL